MGEGRRAREGGGGEFTSRRESLVEEQIRRAIEDGRFDDLPGAGRPLALPARHDENWWLRAKLRREGVPTDALLPPSLRLRKELEGLDAAVADLPDEAAVRAVVAELDRRVVAFLRSPDGPRVPVARPRPDEVVARWRARRAADETPRPAAPPPPAIRPRRRSWWRWWARR